MITRKSELDSNASYVPTGDTFIPTQVLRLYKVVRNAIGNDKTWFTSLHIPYNRVLIPGYDYKGTYLYFKLDVMVRSVVGPGIIGYMYLDTAIERFRQMASKDISVLELSIPTDAICRPGHDRTFPEDNDCLAVSKAMPWRVEYTKEKGALIDGRYRVGGQTSQPAAFAGRDSNRAGPCNAD